jgi:CheY-like chemotaxis protein
MTQKTILLVEDNQSDIDLTIRALNKAHIMNELLIAEDGQEALDYLFATGKYESVLPQTLPALVLLDINLPKINGIEVLRRIRENPKTHRQPVVILTSSTEEADIISTYDLGANSYIRKPVDFNKFAEAIESLGLYWLVLNEIPPE